MTDPGIDGPSPLRVVLATDGSATAGLAVDLVAAIDWPPGTSVLVVESIESGPALFGGPWPSVALVQADALEAALQEEATATVQAVADRLAGHGLRAEAKVLRGRPAMTIVEAALQAEADLIVLGSKGHGTIESMLLGSTSSEVVDHASVPVLVARRRRLDRVVLAWDGSATADRAAGLVRSWPIFARSTIRVVTIADVEAPSWVGATEAPATEAASAMLEASDTSRALHASLPDEMAAMLTAAGLAATAELRQGDAASEIIAAAAADGADLIVLGSHGRTGLARLTMGSVAAKVLRHAPSSVLIVREAPSGAR